MQCNLGLLFKSVAAFVRRHRRLTTLRFDHFFHIPRDLPASIQKSFSKITALIINATGLTLYLNPMVLLPNLCTLWIMVGSESHSYNPRLQRRQFGVLITHVKPDTVLIGVKLISERSSVKAILTRCDPIPGHSVLARVRWAKVKFLEEFGETSLPFLLAWISLFPMLDRGKCTRIRCRASCGPGCRAHRISQYSHVQGQRNYY